MKNGLSCHVKVFLLMKKILFRLFSAALACMFCACGSERQRFTVKGQLNHLKQGQFIIYSYAPQWESFDTIFVENGKFSYSREVGDTLLAYLQYPNYMNTLFVAIPGNVARIKGDANNLIRISVTGSKENEQLTEFRHGLIGKTNKEKLKLAEAFCLEHPQSFASLAVMQEFFLNTDSFQLDKIDKILQVMHAAAPERTQLNIMRTQLAGLLNCRQGKRLPAFTAATLKGDTISNKDFQGKWHFIQMWNTWGMDFYKPVAKAVKYLKAHGDSIQRINICLNNDTLVCQRIIKRDSIDGYNVCDQRGWDSPLIKPFGIHRFPANILVNPKGIIAARDINADDIENELKKYVK